MLHRPLSSTASAGTEASNSTHSTSHHSLTHLPSVSVCIPAHDHSLIEQLTSCLEHILASEYPKLEIIVLNELLTMNPTNEMKVFAHKGVRFVHQGEESIEARDDLLRQASGHLVCFVDVDTHLEPGTIGQLVENFMTGSAAA